MSVARRSRHVVVVLSLALAVVLAGCTPPTRFDPLRAGVAEQRTTARLETADVLAVLAGGTPSLASARIDSCAAGEQNWKRTDPWAYRCSFRYAAVVPAADMAGAQAMIAQNLAELGCDDPGHLSDLLGRWGTLNPGEPLPADEDFQPGVLPPQLNLCGEFEVWTRLSDPTDPQLDRVAAEAANTRDELVVGTRPFSAAEVERFAARDGGVLVFFTVWSMYHEEPR
ncbi:hypothetical protein ACQBAU_09210 [Propionibacteriaceae bacterium Y2011]